MTNIEEKQLDDYVFQTSPSSLCNRPVFQFIQNAVVRTPRLNTDLFNFFKHMQL